MTATQQQAAPANGNDESEEPEKLTIGQKFSDAVTKGMGSWKFVIGQGIVIAASIGLNLSGLAHFDPNLTLLNLALSTESSFAGSFIMMSQNRQAEKDRLTKDKDYAIDIEARAHVRELNRKLDLILAAIPPEQLKALLGDRAAEFAAKPANDNAAAQFEKKPSLSQRFADAVSRTMGSWKFVIGQAIVMTAWIGVNVTGIAPFDPNLTMLNLALSTESALSFAFILMSQSRQVEKDRQAALADLKVDIEAHAEIKELNRKLDILLTVIPLDQLRTILEAEAVKKIAAETAAALAAEVPAEVKPAKVAAAPAPK